MNYKFLLLFIIGFFIFTSDVSAGVCDREHISQLKELANQVDVSYEYLDHGNDMSGGAEGEFVTNSYLVTVNLISDELYIVDELNNEYYFKDYSDGVIQIVVNSGTIKLDFHSKTCAGYKVKSKYINLPKFNTYSYRSECKELEKYDLDVCDPWYQGVITDDKFDNIVQKYLKSDVPKEVTVLDKVMFFLRRYYLFVIGGFAGFIVLMVLFRYYKKRSVLE